MTNTPRLCSVRVRVGGRRAVRPFGDDLRLDERRVLTSWIWFSSAAGISTSTSSPTACRAGVGRRRESRPRSSRARPRIRAASGRRAPSGCRRPLPVGDRDDFRAGLREQISRDRSDVPNPWTATVSCLTSSPRWLGRLRRHDHHAAPGCFAAARSEPPISHRLAGDDRRGRMADVHAVGVHHPRS